MYRHTLTPPPLKSAFSLVELSIVLVILGLLVGGVLSGQALIRAAELRSITTDYQRYLAATLSFRDKYFALPGDMANATQFWGANPSCSGQGGLPYSATTQTLTCNGNGDGHIGQACSGLQYAHEVWHFWQHLSDAGLIEGQYSGACGAASPGNCGSGFTVAVIGLNVPKSKLSNMAFSFMDFDDYSQCYVADSLYFAGQYGHTFVYGSTDGNNFTAYGSGIKAGEAWNIDQKIDDGVPGRGSFRVIPYSNGQGGQCTTTQVAATAAYDLTKTTDSCSLVFVTGF